MRRTWDSTYALYEQFINDADLARETARQILPVGGYTECYWKADLKNFLHMARLRMDPHAQWEIQEYARAMYDLARPLFPITCEAFEDYHQMAVKFSAQEMRFLSTLVNRQAWLELRNRFNGDVKLIAAYLGLSQRELGEFLKKFDLE